MQTQVLILLLICHWLADFTPLSTTWMLKAKSLGKPLFPILIHALVHTILMSLVLVSFVGLSYNLLMLGVIQLTSHFLIDLWKGKMNSWFNVLQSPANKSHWIIFGFDQLLHSIIIVIMSYYTTH